MVGGGEAGEEEDDAEDAEGESSERRIIERKFLERSWLPERKARRSGPGPPLRSGKPFPNAAADQTSAKIRRRSFIQQRNTSPFFGKPPPPFF